jgi:hypothetical protein
VSCGDLCHQPGGRICGERIPLWREPQYAGQSRVSEYWPRSAWSRGVW